MSQNYKRTIVLDTNALHDLDTVVLNTFKEPGKQSIRHYLEILPFLARHNYHIIIPEMVAYEAASILADGVDIDDYFPRADYARNKIPRLDLKKFLKEVIKGQHPNIEVISTTNPPEVSEFLKALHEVVEDYPQPNGEACRNLINIQYKKPAHGGEKAIKAYIDECLTAERIFVVSSDRDALKDLADHHSNTDLINIRGFIDALIFSGLHRKLGMQADVKPLIIVSNMRNQNIQKEEDRKREVMRASIDCTVAEYAAYHRGERLQAPRQYPFYLHCLNLHRKLELDKKLPQQRMKNTDLLKAGLTDSTTNGVVIGVHEKWVVDKEEKLNHITASGREVGEGFGVLGNDIELW